jgi:hypothetical protein
MLHPPQQPPAVSQPIFAPPTENEPVIQPARRARSALARSFGRRWNRGRAKRVRCRKLGARFVCRVSWRHSGRGYKGKVFVPDTGKATVRVRRVT